MKGAYKKIYRRKKGATSKYYKRKAIPPAPWGFSRLVKLRYVDTNIVMNPTPTTNDIYIYRANDLFDPNYSATGHQPRGYDQWMNMYKKSVVLGSKIKCSFTSSDVTNSDVHCIVKVDTEPTSTSDILDDLELRSVKHKIRTGNATYPTVVTHYYSHKKWFPKAKPMTDINQHGTRTSSVTDPVFFIIAVGSQDGTDANALKLTVELEYTAMLFDPINPTIS